MVDQKEIRAKVRTIIGQVAPTPKAAPAPTDRLVDDLGYNSLALMDLAVALEKEFALTSLSEDAAASIGTVEDVEDIVVNLIEEVGG